MICPTPACALPYSPQGNFSVASNPGVNRRRKLLFVPRASSSPAAFATSMPSKTSSLKLYSAQETVTITLSGDYDFSTKRALAAILSQAENAKTAVIDFTTTHYIDCSCLSTLVQLHTKMLFLHGNADIRLVGVSRHIKRIFTLCKFNTIFSMFATVQEALAVPTR